MKSCASGGGRGGVWRHPKGCDDGANLHARHAEAGAGRAQPAGRVNGPPCKPCIFGPSDSLALKTPNGGVNHRCRGVKHWMKAVNHRVKGVKNRMKGLNQGMKGVIYRMKALKNRMKGVIQRVKGVNQGMKGVANRVRGVKNRMKGVFHPFHSLVKCFWPGFRAIIPILPRVNPRSPRPR